MYGALSQRSPPGVLVMLTHHGIGNEACRLRRVLVHKKLTQIPENKYSWLEMSLKVALNGQIAECFSTKI